MSTVFAGVSRYSYPGDELTDEGVAGINTLAARILDDRFPEQAPWTPVPGGQANGEWNRLVNGNDYATPADEQSEVIDAILTSLAQDEVTPDSWWEDA